MAEEMRTVVRGANPKGLEGKGRSSTEDDDGENSRVVVKAALGNREFFWDSVVLYVVSAIIGLTAVDLISEYIRGTGVECIATNGMNISTYQKYINSFCRESIPASEYFPTFIVIQSILIAAPHYLWLNQFGGRFEFFFARTKNLVRSKNRTTGEYPLKNYVFIQQLESAFGTYRSLVIYWWYVLKLGLQLALSSIALGVAIVYFSEFNDNFRCPRDFDSNVTNESSSRYWPLGVQVSCVYSSLRLLALIRAMDIFLLALVAAGLAWALLWCFHTHKTELGSYTVAKFTFQSGLEPDHHNIYFKKHRLPTWCNRTPYVSWFSRLCDLFDFRGAECINSDLDFLILRLFRADSGLGSILKDVQVRKAVRDLNDEDHNWVELHRTHQVRAPKDVEELGALVDKEYVMSDTQWTFSKEKCDEAAREGSEQERRDRVQGREEASDSDVEAERQQFGVLTAVEEKRVKNDKLLVIPPSMRGAVIGFAARSPANYGAITVEFGTPSLGFAFALARIFKRVGCAVFSPHYHNPDEGINITSFGGAAVHVATCAENFLAHDYESQYMPKASMLWRSPDCEPMRTNFILVGPMTSQLQTATVNVFLDRLSAMYLNKECLLLIVQPIEIGGRNVRSKFQVGLEYNPPNLFGSKKHCTEVSKDRTTEHEWPPTSPERMTKSPGRSSFDFEVWCGDTRCVYNFRVFENSVGTEDETSDSDTSDSAIHAALRMDGFLYRPILLKH